MLLALASGAAADCPAPADARSGAVRHVVDGDTLILDGDVNVRLIGIDAPEIGRDGLPDDPYAAAARAELGRLIETGGDRIRYLAGTDARDRYGRLLAYVFGADGRNLAERLLRRGLAYQTVIPPNDRFLDCYRAAEEDARQHRLGLWSRPALDAARLPGDVTGFERVQGRVETVRTRRGRVDITLAGGLHLRIEPEDVRRFDEDLLDALPGSRVEVRGWIYRYRGEPRIRLRDPSALRQP